jgi:demethylmenaquinone methyltransferase / 2-methoxy-6-polyprenyl-1,4-benzoquinol methylase
MNVAPDHMLGANPAFVGERAAVERLMTVNTDPKPPHDGAVHAPHGVLSEYYQDAAAREAYVRQTFDDTAEDYDRIERLIGFGSGPWYRRQALLRAGLRPGLDVVDVGMGTGLVAKEIIRVTGEPTRLTGVDPSPGMISQSGLPQAVRCLDGRAERMPLPNASADFISMGYALRHIADLSAAFAEFARVLKPGGRVLILEITPAEGTFTNTLLRAYMRGVVPTLAKLVARKKQTAELWRYYWDTIEACAPPPAVLRTLADAGFEAAERHVELGIFSEYRAVRRVA